MKNTLKTISKVFSVIIFSLIIFSSAFASEINSQIDVNSSIYKYSAIETNSINPNQIEISTNTLPITEDIKLPVDIETKLQNIYDKQKFSIEEINKAINEINNNGVKNFLIGNNLGVLKFQLVQINNYIFRLNDMIKMTENGPNLNQIDSINTQIIFLQKEQVKVENFVLIKEKKFSLFGWLVASL